MSDKSVTELTDDELRAEYRLIDDGLRQDWAPFMTNGFSVIRQCG